MKQLLLFTLGLLMALDAIGQPARVDSLSAPISIKYFGLHLHRSDQGTAWPNVPFGSWRLWDAYVNWSQIEPRKDQWDFSRLDRYVAMAKLADVDVLLPLANTPRWAAARPDESSAYQPGNASEPLSMEDWRTFVKTMGERYKGRIRHYEIWNEPNIKRHFSGTPTKLVELTCEAYNILKAIDPANQIVSPAATAGAEGHVAYLNNFLALGGGQCIDIVAHHFYVPKAGPEAMVPLIRQVRIAMRNNGVGQKPLWNTEFGAWFADNDERPTPTMMARGGWKKLGRENESGNYLLHAFLLARAEGVERFYWYSWDHRGGLGFLESDTDQPKPVVSAWRDAVDRLLGATNLRCDSAAKAWRCQFVSRDGKAESISWVAE